MQRKRGDGTKISYSRQVWRRFRRHRVGLIGLCVLIILYICAVFAEFIAPNDPYERFGYPYMPPQRIHFRDSEGNFSLHPFVYGIRYVFNPAELQNEYEEDVTARHYLGLFVRAKPYRILGLIPASVRLFGTEDGTPFLPLGTNKLGQCLLSRIIYGARISLTVGLLGILIATVIGIVVGGIAGYFGGMVDNLIQRFIEIVMSLPAVPLWLALAAAIPPSWPQTRVYLFIVSIFGFLSWPPLARVVRGKFLSLREEEFVLAAKAYGASALRIIIHHLLPNFMSYILVNMTLAVPQMIIGETVLSFLGLGLRPPAISWGVLLQEARSFQTFTHYPWLLIPGLFVTLAVLAFNAVGDALRDAVDPYAEQRRA